MSLSKIFLGASCLRSIKKKTGKEKMEPAVLGHVFLKLVWGPDVFGPSCPEVVVSV